jgi:DNA-binding CsgD family transcriptional regulator
MRPRNQKVFAAVSIGFFCITITTTFISLSVGELTNNSQVMSMASISTQIIGSAMLMVLWGLVFVTMDKRLAAGAITAAALLSVGISLPLTLVLNNSLVIIVVNFLLLLSPTMFLMSKSSLVVERRDCGRIPKNKKHPIIGFYTMRAAFGLSSGIISTATALILPALPSPMVNITAALAILLLSAFIVQIKGWHSLTKYLPVIPFVLAGIIIIPLVSDYLQVFEKIPTIGWLAWIIVSSVQLSELKHRFNMSDSFLTISEKATVTAFWSIGVLITPVLSDTLFNNAETAFVSQLSLLFGFVVLVWAIGSLLTVMNNRERDRLIQKISLTMDDNTDYIYDQIVKDHDLSPREKEVFALLAQGYARNSIANKLFIAEGTVQTHVKNIYGKLGCHKKEELFDLVDKYKS